MRHVARVLPRAVENAEVLRAARAGAVLRRWEEIVGPMLAAKSVPDRFDKGTVWVATQGSAWAQELRLMKPRILERMEAMAGERGMFLDVRFGVRPPKVADLGPRISDLRDDAAPERSEGAYRPAFENPTEEALLKREPAVEKGDPEAYLSIRERAARRLANWPKGE